jgi:hypothetical protein
VNGGSGNLIRDGYALGAVSATLGVAGGLVGQIDVTASDTRLDFSYARGAVSGGANLGGLIGVDAAGAQVSYAFWDQDTSGQSTSAGGTGLKTYHFKDKSLFKGWAFGAYWISPAEVGLAAGPPLLRSQIDYDTSYCEDAAHAGAAPFAGGDGSAGTPYLICTAAQLDEVRNHLADSFKLMQDVDLAGLAETFLPIGSSGSPFTGTFDGNGFRVLNFIYTTDSGSDFIGLFSAVTGTIRNLGVMDADVEGRERVGALVGYTDSGAVIENSYATGQVVGGMNTGGGTGGLVGALTSATVSDCYADVDVSASGNWVGGLVGESKDGSVTDSFALGATAGEVNVGGLIGYSWSTADIQDSYAFGEVSGDQQVGGLAGEISGSGTIERDFAEGSVSSTGSGAGGFAGRIDNATVRYAYAKGAVSGLDRVGGFAGRMDSGNAIDAYATGAVVGTGSPSAYAGGFAGYFYNSSTLSRAYSAGAVSFTNGGGTDIGGLVGGVSGAVSVKYSYWDTTTSGQAASAGGSGLTSAQLQAKTNFTGWPWGAYWISPADAGLAAGSPILRSQVIYDLSYCDDAAHAGASPFAGGAGTAGDPYLICTATQLDEVRNSLNAFFKLMQDVDLSGSWANAFVPIGDGGSPFTGTFDGNGFRILNFTRNTPGSDYVSVFGVLQGTVRNLGATDVDVTGRDRVGGLIAYADNGSTIENCYSTGVVTGGQNIDGGTGGLLGSGAVATISSSYSAAQVSSSGDKVGGLIGEQASGAVQDSYAIGAITGNDETGGLIGSLHSAGGVSTSYALGDASGNEGVGGLVGYLDTGSSVDASFAEGNVSGAAVIGGLIGDMEGAGSMVTDSSAAGDVTGTDVELGGLIGILFDGTVTDSSASGSVSADSVGDGRAGGLIGRTFNAVIQRCSATGSAQSNYEVGGLVGLLESTTLEDSYSSGDASEISNGTEMGGLIGRAVNGTITRCYSIGAATGLSNVGGLLGENYSGGTTVSSSYWNSDSNASGPDGTGLTSAQMQVQGNFSGWDFTAGTGVWLMPGGAPPQLQ